MAAEVGPVIGPMQFLTPLGFIQNYTATIDPVATNDASQGFGPGSEWLNLTNGRLWTNAVNTPGAAVWVFSGVATALGGEPSGITTQFGSSTAFFPEEGNINRQISATGVSSTTSPASQVLAAYTLPANGFDVAGRGLQITAAGSFATNGNNKLVAINIGAATAVVGSAVGSGGTVIATTGTVTTSNAGWEISANVFKYGAAGSNTQLAIHSQAQVGNAVSALTIPALLTMTENAAINIAIICTAATGAGDVVFNWLEINAMN